MRPVDLFSSAFRAISINGGRSLLTMLGIIIGVGSVTLMTGIGHSMEGVILSQISILGADNMVVFPGKGPEGGGIQSVGYDSLSFEDIEKLQSLKTIKDISPIINISESVSAGTETTSSSVSASNPLYFSTMSVEVQAGRFFDNSDEEAARKVAVLGTDAAKDLFYNQNPIGQKIKIGANSFTVIGLAQPLGTAFFQNQDKKVYIPLSVGRQMSQQSYVDQIVFLRTVDSELAQRDVTSYLRQIEGITNPDDDTFVVRTSVQAEQILGSVSLGLTAFITFIATISLIVGGIGIMNIMLVAVTERTREIGLRKAIGAKRSDILYQFLIESVCITLIGGFIGLLGGLFLSYFLALILHKFLIEYVFAVSPTAMIVAMAMAGITGLIFGVYPARQAASLSPMEALRYE